MLINIKWIDTFPKDLHITPVLITPISCPCINTTVYSFSEINIGRIEGMWFQLFLWTLDLLVRVWRILSISSRSSVFIASYYLIIIHVCAPTDIFSSQLCTRWTWFNSLDILMWHWVQRLVWYILDWTQALSATGGDYQLNRKWLIGNFRVRYRILSIKMVFHMLLGKISKGDINLYIKKEIKKQYNWK